MAMKIKMLRNSLGSDDGHTVKHYDAGETYDVSDDLAKSFVGEKIAEVAPGEKAEAAPENKAVGKAPKNKAEAAPENK
jgi:hypothetical protein